MLFVHEVPIKEIKANLIQTLNMCYAISKKGVKVKLLVLIQISEDKAYKIVDSVIPKFNDFFEVDFLDYAPSRSFFSSMDRFSRLKKYIDLNYEYIFTRSPLVSIYVTKKKKKLIYESHNSYFTKHKGLNFYYKFKFKSIIKKNSFKLFLSISNNLEKFWIQNNISNEKSLALHDGTSSVNTVFIPKKDIPFKNPTRLKVTYTGSLYKDRGINRLLALAYDFPELDFIIIGGPNQNAIDFKIEAKEKGLRNIDFIGYVDHKFIPYYLSKSDILLALWSRNVPTIDYCSPLKIFEYMYSNKLIVADGFTTIKEVLTDKVNALLCEPDNYESLKSILQEIVKEKELLKIGNNNRELIELEYSWEKRAELILERLT